MKPHLKLTIFTISIIVSFCISRMSTVSAIEAAAPFTDPSSIIFSPHPQSPIPSQETQEFLNPITILEPILTNLGFLELASAVPSLSDSAVTTWNGPLTVFAPSDSSIRSCRDSCSVPRLLREHIVPGLFSLDYLQKLVFGTKLETMSPGRCITVTSTSNNDTNMSKIIFIGGVEITHPDVFYNGLVVVHRLQGFVSPLSPFSCNIERMSSLSFPPQPSINSDRTTRSFPTPSPAIMRLMLRDAMLRLHNNGYSVLALALRVKYPELVTLQNMTIFTLDDISIFSGGHAYVSNVRFHIVPNRLLMNADLLRLPAGTTLDSLERGQKLVVTTSGEGGSQMRINYVRIKIPDVMYNLKIVVHSVFLPFPHLQVPSASSDYGSNEGSTWNAAAGASDSGMFQMNNGGAAPGSCVVSENKGCAAVPPSLERKTTVF